MTPSISSSSAAKRGPSPSQLSPRERARRQRLHQQQQPQAMAPRPGPSAGAVFAQAQAGSSRSAQTPEHRLAYLNQQIDEAEQELAETERRIMELDEMHDPSSMLDRHFDMMTRSRLSEALAGLNERIDGLRAERDGLESEGAVDEGSSFTQPDLMRTSVFMHAHQQTSAASTGRHNVEAPIGSGSSISVQNHLPRAIEQLGSLGVDTDRLLSVLLTAEQAAAQNGSRLSTAERIGFAQIEVAQLGDPTVRGFASIAANAALSDNETIMAVVQSTLASREAARTVLRQLGIIPDLQEMNDAMIESRIGEAASSEEGTELAIEMRPLHVWDHARDLLLGENNTRPLVPILDLALRLIHPNTNMVGRLETAHHVVSARNQPMNSIVAAYAAGPIAKLREFAQAAATYSNDLNLTVTTLARIGAIQSQEEETELTEGLVVGNVP